jgi:hypothetical protein
MEGISAKHSIVLGRRGDLRVSIPAAYFADFVTNVQGAMRPTF